MPGKIPKGPKDPFADLSQDFRDAVDAADRVEIRKTVAQVALDQAELMEAQALDEDFSNAKAAASEAGAVYREGTKINRLKIKYAKQVLEGKGG